MVRVKKTSHTFKPAQTMRRVHHAVKAKNISLHANYEFLAMVAHELRNLLAPVITTMPLMHDHCKSDKELVTSIDTVERQVHHMRRLLDDLLDVTRIKRGKIELQKEQVNAADVVNHAVESARTLIDKQRHNLEIALPENPPWLHADPMRLEQIMVNLLINAAKYTEPGGHIWLTVTEETGYAVFSVRDTGIGIAPQMLTKIFEIYRQAHPDYAGIGIGLTIIKNLTEIHGGTVSVKSEGLGKGSEFTVRIPIGQI